MWKINLSHALRLDKRVFMRMQTVATSTQSISLFKFRLIRYTVNNCYVVHYLQAIEFILTTNQLFPII